MTGLCGWLANNVGGETASVVDTMGRAMRTHSRQSWTQWSKRGLSIGLLEVPEAEEGGRDPAVSQDARFHLWMAGEAFAGGSFVEVPGVEATRRLPFREALLRAVLERGEKVILELDGEYQIVLWDAREHVLTIVNDRFGGLPLYWARSRDGFGFAGGVRGVLVAPGVPADPDSEALREAVTFGGYRLGDRTNVAAIKMMPGASIVTVQGGLPSFRRYWHWADIQPLEKWSTRELVEEAHGLWRQAIRRRLAGAKSPGQTLSGGLDSRAILAEAVPVAPNWAAITYGLPRADDVLYAQRAAEAVGATWVFHPLYSGRDPDWLERRTSYIQGTDGLIQLVDLMHLEALPLQASLLDMHLSGYSGDAVCGTTYDQVKDARTLANSLSFYGTSIGWSYERALSWAEAAIAKLAGAAPRYAIFEHKYPQAIHRIFQSYASWLRVRKPFSDYELFDFYAGLKEAGVESPYWRMLRGKYPACFSVIPNQKTGVRILAPDWCVWVARAGRFTWRQIQPCLAKVGLPAQARVRYYHNDETLWNETGIRQRIESTILRPGSICCDILGREAVARVVTDWFDRAAGPTQVIGALYVFETYHRDLTSHLRAARQVT